MCQFKSAVVGRTGEIYHHWSTDGHEDIIEMFGLSEADICRVEFSSTTYEPANIESYALRVDEREEPAWFDEYRERVTKDMGRLVAGMMVRENTRILRGGKWILVGDVEVGKCLSGCLIEYANNATIRDAGNATIENANNATIRYADNATIRYAGNATIRDAGNATIRDAGNATIRYANNATIEYAGNATIEYANNATIENADNATIRYANNATIRDAGNATIVNRDA